MGALFGEQSMINRESYSNMISDGLNIGFYAGFSALDAVNASFHYNNTESETFKKYVKEQNVYSRGAAPPGDLNPFTWVSNTYEEPMVLDMNIEPIYELPIQELVSSPSVLSNLRQAVEEYCPKLLEEGKIASCELPNTDPSLPEKTSKMRELQIKTRHIHNAGQNGHLSLHVCNSDESNCCIILDIDNYLDNFEPGHLDGYTGAELGECAGFEISESDTFRVTLLHEGHDGWFGQYIRILMESGTYFECPITTWIDNDDIKTIDCSKGSDM